MAGEIVDVVGLQGTNGLLHPLAFGVIGVARRCRRTGAGRAVHLDELIFHVGEIVTQTKSKAKARKSSCCGGASATAYGSEVGSARRFVYVGG